MAATARRLITTRTTGTRWCWPRERSQASAGYPMRAYRYDWSMVMPNAVAFQLAGSSASR
jgi:hypothetical protein